MCVVIYFHQVNYEIVKGGLCIFCCGYCCQGNLNVCAPNNFSTFYRWLIIHFDCHIMAEKDFNMVAMATVVLPWQHIDSFVKDAALFLVVVWFKAVNFRFSGIFCSFVAVAMATTKP